MTIHSLVHCHVCPLKDFCSSGNKDASWRIEHNGQIMKRQEGTFRVQTEEKDYEAMSKATANCPLRRAVAFVDTKLTKELLQKMG